jgi:phosphosulfolactate phosphohydrolase-like enzyme
VVIDILFATTTMVAALAHGATEIVPVLDEAAAREAACSRASSMPKRCRALLIPPRFPSLLTA